MTDPMREPLNPCPLCRSPHVNVARNLSGKVEQVFCKACGCSAPVSVWSVRLPVQKESEVERVAEALWLESYPSHNVPAWSSLAKGTQRIWHKRARAALSSMDRRALKPPTGGEK